MADSVQLCFRLPVDMVNKIDARVNSMRHQNQGLKVTRVDVVRLFIERGLSGGAALRAEAARTVPARKRVARR